jgi:hypothetical protein
LGGAYLLHYFWQWPSFNWDNKLIPLRLSLINLLPTSFSCEYLPFNLLPSSLWVFIAKGWNWILEHWNARATWGFTHLLCIFNFSITQSNYGVCCVYSSFFLNLHLNLIALNAFSKVDSILVHVHLFFLSTFGSCSCTIYSFDYPFLQQ